jgi:hypothetical protein
MENLEVNGYTLVNPEKIQRAMEGQPTPDGSSKGGVAREDGSYDANALLAEYDKLGGLIKKGSDRVKTGSFYDFKARKAHAEPKVFFIYNVNGSVVEVAEHAEAPGIIKAVRMLQEQEVEEVEEAPKKKRVKKS